MKSKNSCDPRPHALVVGGTGMLRGVVLRFLSGGWTTSVIARGRQRMDSLIREAHGLPGAVVPLRIDYRHETDLEHTIRLSQQQHGRITVAICWIHSSPPRGLLAISRAIADLDCPPWLVHVRSSTRRYPGSRSSLKAQVVSGGGVEYAEVILGYVRGPDTSRWLTNEEISEGVWSAYAVGNPTASVGVIDPWDGRP